MKIIILILTLAYGVNTYTQVEKNVILKVTGQGNTSDEAVQNALRNALEQTFGTFISSNTEILNDNLIKDEIVSVTNGNIQDYQVLSQVQSPNGIYSTALKATVSVSKLTSFVESKGVVVEFKGSVLAANIKQQKLNEENEKKSIQNIANTCKEILDLSCDFELNTGEPKQMNNNNNQWAIPLAINVKFNKNIEQFGQYYYNSIKGLSMSESEVEQYKQLGKKTYKVVIGEPGVTGGVTSNIGDLNAIAASNNNYTYNISYENPSRGYQTDNIDYLVKRFKQKRKQGLIPKIHYYDKSMSTILHFRTKDAVRSIIDVIMYTKHALLNFEISNGIHVRTFENIEDFKVLECDFEPIFNSGLLIKGPRPYTSNGPVPIFTVDAAIVENYKPINGGRGLPNMKYCYNGYNHRAQMDKTEIYTKYPFLPIAENIAAKLPVAERSGYKKVFEAVISLYDYKVDVHAAYDVRFSFEDKLSLTEIEKLEEYKINSKQ